MQLKLMSSSRWFRCLSSLNLINSKFSFYRAKKLQLNVEYFMPSQSPIKCHFPRILYLVCLCSKMHHCCKFGKIRLVFLKISYYGYSECMNAWRTNRTHYVGQRHFYAVDMSYTCSVRWVTVSTISSNHLYRDYTWRQLPPVRQVLLFTCRVQQCSARRRSSLGP